MKCCECDSYLNGMFRWTFTLHLNTYNKNHLQNFHFYAFIAYLVTFLCPSQCYLSRLFFVLVQSTLSAGRDCGRVGPCPPPNVFTTVDRRYVENLFQDPENFHFFLGWPDWLGYYYRAQGPYSQHFTFFVSYKWALKARVLHYTRLERIASNKHPGLIGTIRKLKRKWSVVNMAPGYVFTTLHFFFVTY